MTGGGGAGGALEGWQTAQARGRQQRLETFGKAIRQLTNACELADSGDLARAAMSRYETLTRAGLIGMFELSRKLSWQVLQDALLHDGLDVEAPRSVIRKSFEVGYIDESDCETLLDAMDKRRLFSRAYRNDIALKAEGLIKERYHPALLRLYRSLNEGVEWFARDSARAER